MAIKHSLQGSPVTAAWNTKHCTMAEDTPAPSSNLFAKIRVMKCHIWGSWTRIEVYHEMHFITRKSRTPQVFIGSECRSQGDAHHLKLRQDTVPSPGANDVIFLLCSINGTYFTHPDFPVEQKRPHKEIEYPGALLTAWAFKRGLNNVVYVFCFKFDNSHL